MFRIRPPKGYRGPPTKNSPVPQKGHSHSNRPTLPKVISTAPASPTNPTPPVEPATPTPDSAGRPVVSSNPYSPEQETQDRLNQEFNPKIATLLRAQQQGKNTYQAGVTGTQQYGAGFDSKLNEIYDKLRGQLQGGQQQVVGTYQQAQGAVGGGYDMVAGALSKAGTEAQNGLAGMAPQESRLAQFLAMAKAQNEQGKAASLGNLSTNAASANTNIQGGIDAVAGEGATQRADLVKQVAGQLGNLNLTQLKNDGEIQRQLSNLEAQKGTAYQTLLQQVKDARTEAEATAAKDAFVQEIQENTLQIQMAKLGLATDKQGFDQGIASSKLGLDTQKFGTDTALKQSAQALTTRGQDLTRQSVVDRIAATEASTIADNKAKATPALSLIDRRKAQMRVISNLKKSASKKTIKAFYKTIEGNKDLQGAMSDLRQVKDSVLKKDGISRKSLETWINQYYLYK